MGSTDVAAANRTTATPAASLARPRNRPCAQASTTRPNSVPCRLIRRRPAGSISTGCKLAERGLAVRWDRMPAAADEDRCLREGRQAEAPVDVLLIDGGRNEGSKSEVGADEVQRLAQVRGVEEEDAIRLRVCLVLPEVPREARGEKEEGLGSAEMFLSGGELD